MKIEFSVNDDDIQKGIATWAAHRTTAAIDYVLTSQDFIQLIRKQVMRQVQPMLDNIVVELSDAEVQRYADKYIQTYMQSKVREVIQSAKGVDRANIEAIVRKALLSVGM